MTSTMAADIMEFMPGGLVSQWLVELRVPLATLALGLTGAGVAAWLIRERR